MLPFLAKPQMFVVKPAPGWLDLARHEVGRILNSPLQKYKFSPDIRVMGNSLFIANCDYRQALEIVLRATLVHDVEIILHSGRVTTRAGWQDFFDKTKIKDIWPPAKELPLHLTIRVTHPVVGTEKEVRDKLTDYLKTHGIYAKKTLKEADMAVSGRLRIESEKNRTQMLLSLAGKPLYMRSYKDVLSGASAPLPEHHAAACFRWSMDVLGGSIEMLLVSGNVPLVIPFAGTGTMGFESVGQMLKLAPGLLRSDYAFKRFLFHPVKTSATIERRLLSGMTGGRPRVIFGDVDLKACENLKLNIAGFERRTRDLLAEDKHVGSFTIVQNDFLKEPATLIKDEGQIFLLMNPPYGERLAKMTGPEVIYALVGRVLKQLGQRLKVSGLVLCGNEVSWREFLAGIGPLSHKTRHFTHGGCDVRAVVFSNVEVLKSR